MDYNYRQPRSYSSSSTNYSGNLLQFITLLSYIMYAYFILNKYAVGGNGAWAIVPLVITGVLTIANVAYNQSLSSVILLLVMGLSLTSLYVSADKIRDEKDNQTQSFQLQIKYLVAIVVFLGISLLTISPLGNWIAGETQGSLYSTSFLFIFSLLCFSFYIMYDSIRYHNLFGLKQLMFGDSDEKIQSSNTGTIVVLGLWVLYSLVSFEGLQFVGSNTSGDVRQYVTIAIFTIVWVILAFTNSERVNQSCKTWNQIETKNTSQEIYLNIITYTILLLLLSTINRFRKL